MGHGALLLWGLPPLIGVLGFAVPRWWWLGLPAVACSLWTASAWGRVDPYSFSWTTGDVLATAMFGLLLGEVAVTIGVTAGRVPAMPHR